MNASLLYLAAIFAAPPAECPPEFKALWPRYHVLVHLATCEDQNWRRFQEEASKQEAPRFDAPLSTRISFYCQGVKLADETYARSVALRALFQKALSAYPYDTWCNYLTTYFEGKHQDLWKTRLRSRARIYYEIYAWEGKITDKRLNVPVFHLLKNLCESKNDHIFLRNVAIAEIILTDLYRIHKPWR
jgi:hypothetical protein